MSLCALLQPTTMLNLQLYEALEMYFKWFSYQADELPLSAMLVLTCQWEFLLFLGILSTVYTFQMSATFLAHLTNMVCFYRAFMRSQHPPCLFTNSQEYPQISSI
jgi:hypothetical protein